MSTNLTVYLAGAMSGRTKDEMYIWRKYATRYLEKRGFRVLSPLRGKTKLFASGNPPQLSDDVTDYQHLGPFYESRGIMERDHGDVHSADILLVKLLGDETRSAGTLIELGWAYHAHIPRVCVIEPFPNSIYDSHPMAREAIGGFRYECLHEALAAVSIISGAENA